MNEPGPVTSDESRAARPVFISYATADRKEALSVCKAIERRGTQCWISTRDVSPGGNYQEEIVRAIRTARAMVLVFSAAANNSDEIKKELSLASRHHVTVIALRIEDVEPSDAFAYELSTRQWIEAFEGWDHSIDALVSRLEQVPGVEPAKLMPHARARRSGTMPLSRRSLVVCATLLMIVAGLAAWLLMRPNRAAAHSMQVRLIKFERTSADLPSTMPDALRDEIIAAFSDDGVVNISTAPAPPTEAAPAYALGGTIRRDGDKIKVIARLTNERTGATLWSNGISYDSDQVSHIPRWAAIDLSVPVRCGLFGASTYPGALPDATMNAYFQYCGSSAAAQQLDFARKVVAATPDFSWGWSAVEIASQNAALSKPTVPDKDDLLMKESWDAAAAALRLDPKNSEALAYKSYLIDGGDLLARESLLEQAVAARPLACGCEHHFYGNLLMEVGRVTDAVAEYRRAVAAQPLSADSRITLAETLLAAGKPEEAKTQFEVAADLVPETIFADELAIETAPLTGDYAAGLKALTDPKIQLPAALRSATHSAFEAMVSHNTAAKTEAILEVAALPPRPTRTPILLLGALGANRQALQRIEDLSRWGGPRLYLWEPSMAGALRDPTFPAVAKRLGLVKYWRTTHTKPDICSAKDPPPFCREI